jgi:hypothetical protein
MDSNTPPTPPTHTLAIHIAVDEKYGPTISIGRDELDKYAHRFGLTKAKNILTAIEDIRAFVAKYDTDAKKS